MILVTGAAGFIGCNLVRELNKAGETEIILCDILGQSAKWKNLLGLNYREYVEGPDLFNSIKDRTDIQCIFHLGACSDTLEEDMSYLVKNNFEFSKELFLYSKSSSSRFIYASSAATYGFGENGFSDDHNLLEKLRPLNKYGFSKHLFDLWLLRNNYLNDAVGLKYFNIYGPYEDHKDNMRSLVNKAYQQVSDTGKIKLFKSNHPDYKDGEQKRDFLYVKDAVKMTIHFMKTTDSGIFNIGSGRAETWNQLATALFKAINRKANIEYINMPDAISSQYQNYTCADIDKLRAAQYAENITSLENAVSDYVKSHLSKTV
ncbi:MAG: ADP-glyceromanno-heptose 6-epimerase [Calditrichaeota bacterium]|nr:ADP-glyceromanno-heptose 6-epimerase [Calditrichota bacterium]